jgi:hypothetical protein
MRPGATSLNSNMIRDRHPACRLKPASPAVPAASANPLGINNPRGGAEANQFSFELAYDTGTGERGDQQNVYDGIVFTITNPPDAKWSVVENCKELSFK